MTALTFEVHQRARSCRNCVISKGHALTLCHLALEAAITPSARADRGVNTSAACQAAARRALPAADDMRGPECKMN